MEHMSTAQAQELQQQLRELLRSLQLPDTAVRNDAPPLLQQLDIPAARQLLQAANAWDERGLFDESERLVNEVILKAPESRASFFASEVELLQRLRDSGEDQLHRDPFGLVELVLPLNVRGYHLHLLRSGKFREQPFTDNERKELAFSTGIPRATVDSAAQELPIRSGEVLATFIAQQRHLRDALAAALDAQLQLALLGKRNEPSEGLAHLGAFAEGAAHQFSDLLSIILGYSSLVLAKNELADDAAEALNHISEAAQKGRRLTEQILTMSGAQFEDESSCALHERLKSALALLQADSPRAAALSLDLQAEHDHILASPSAIHSSVGNFLRAASEAAAEDTALSIRTRNVTENGIQQIVIEIVEKKGRKRTSDTTSRIAFPVISEPLAYTKKQVRRRLAPSTIWVADDDPAVRALCARVLAAEGHTIQEHSSGEAVQAAIKAGNASLDLLIYDFNMPDVDGVELCTWLRQQPRVVPVILISGFNAEHTDLKRVLQMRKVFLLQKPFSYRDMSDLVTIAMGETLVG